MEQEQKIEDVEALISSKFNYISLGNLAKLFEELSFDTSLTSHVLQKNFVENRIFPPEKYPHLFEKNSFTFENGIVTNPAFLTTKASKKTQRKTLL